MRSSGQPRRRCCRHPCAKPAVAAVRSGGGRASRDPPGIASPAAGAGQQDDRGGDEIDCGAARPEPAGVARACGPACGPPAGERLLGTAEDEPRGGGATEGWLGQVPLAWLWPGVDGSLHAIDLPGGPLWRRGSQLGRRPRHRPARHRCRGEAGRGGNYCPSRRACRGREHCGLAAPACAVGPCARGRPRGYALAPGPRAATSRARITCLSCSDCRSNSWVSECCGLHGAYGHCWGENKGPVGELLGRVALIAVPSDACQAGPPTVVNRDLLS